MKKIVSVISVCFLLLGFIACGGDDSNSSSTGSSSSISSSLSSFSSSISSSISSSSSSGTTVPNFVGVWNGTLVHYKNGLIVHTHSITLTITNQVATNFTGHSMADGDGSYDSLQGTYNQATGTFSAVVSDTNDTGYGTVTGNVDNQNMTGSFVQHGNRTDFSDGGTITASKNTL